MENFGTALFSKFLKWQGTAEKFVKSQGIAGHGNLGIGTTSPSRLLDVNGVIQGSALKETGTRTLQLGSCFKSCPTSGDFGSSEIRFSSFAGTSYYLWIPLSAGYNITSIKAYNNADGSPAGTLKLFSAVYNVVNGETERGSASIPGTNQDTTLTLSPQYTIQSNEMVYVKLTTTSIGSYYYWYWPVVTYQVQ